MPHSSAIFFLFFFFLPLLLLSSFFFFFSSVYMFFKFYLCLYLIWENHKVPLICYQKPPGTTKDSEIFVEKFSNLCMLYLCLLMIYLFSFGYWKNLWVHALYFFFLLWIYALSLHALYISMFKSPFNLWQKNVQPPFSLFKSLWIKIWLFKFKHNIKIKHFLITFYSLLC